MLRALLLCQMVGTSLSSVLFAAHPPIILAVFLATTIPILPVFIFKAEAVRVLPLLLWGGVILLTLCIGYMLNPLSADPIVKISIVFLIFAVGWVSAIQIRSVAIVQSMTVSALAGLLATATQLYREGLSAYFEKGERLTGGDESHPNLVGLTMVCVGLCGASTSNVFVRYIFFIISFLISYVVQSRNAMMSLLVIIAISIWRDFVRHLNVIGIITFALLAPLTLALSFNILVADFSNLFQLDNPYRGSDSNLVGRLELWQATWNLFTDYPIFGFGLGQHQIGADIEMYAHNMYLIILSESGQVGLFAFVVATIIALRGLYLYSRTQPDTESNLTFALTLVVVIYYIYGIFEGRAVNAGNFLSYLFFFAWGYGISCFNSYRELAAVRVRTHLVH